MNLRICEVGLIASLLIGGCLSSPAPGQDAPKFEPPVIGIGRMHAVPSATLGEPVNLVVHLPADYAAGGQRYPVLLFLGSDYRARFALAAATLDYMGGQGQLPGMILVGVDLPHGNFVLVPRESAEGTASADRHARALAEEVIPFVDRTFRTNGYRILYGGSNCGLFAVYALLTEQVPAQAYFASSPMLGWCPDLIAEKTRAAFADADRPRRFLHLVGSDDDYERVTRELPKLVAMLEKGAPAWLQWKAEIRNNEGHVPEMDLPLALRALFPDYNPATDLKTLREMQDHYARLSARYGFPIEVPDSLLFNGGFDLANRSQLDEAQRIFEYGVERYPRRANLRAGLGFVCRQKGETATAVGHLKKALELDPANGWARRQLADLEKSG